MFIVLLSILIILLGLLTRIGKGPLVRFFDKGSSSLNMVSVFIVAIGFIGIFSRSFVYVDKDQVGLLERIYLASELPVGRIVALDGEKGPQARILGPGFHFILFGRVLYDIDFAQVHEVPEGQLGVITTKDGLPLPDGQFMAQAWNENNLKDMLDATYFLTEGKGIKGPQVTVLRPGRYRLNPYLYEVKNFPALDVPTGHVAVIRSNIQEREGCPSANDTVKGRPNNKVAAPIVPKGCIGVWDTPLSSGRYYLNQRAYVPTTIPTRVQKWAYKGGYTKRTITLTVEEDGTIKQQESSETIAVPKNAADKAIFVRVEGWTVPVELRVLAQVYPKNAPITVAAVGGVNEVEDRIITPAIRDILRTIGGNKERKVLDFMEMREEIANLVEQAIIPEAAKAGVTIQEVRLGEPAIPPELLVATLREQLATQLKETFKKEQQAQAERIKVERDRATAEQQSVLVEAEIKKKAAEHTKTQLELEGEGEKLKMIEIAEGQKAQARILGKERTLQLQLLKEILTVAKDNPDIIKVPTVQVNGAGGSSLEGAAAILGSSNFVNLMNQQKTAKPEK